MQQNKPLPPGAEPTDQPLSLLQLAERDWQSVQTVIIQEGRAYSELLERHASNDATIEEVQEAQRRLNALRALRDSVFEQVTRDRVSQFADL